MSDPAGARVKQPLYRSLYVQVICAVIIGVLATAAIIGGAIALANNDDDPDSP